MPISCTLSSPLGCLTIIATGDAITEIRFPGATGPAIAPPSPILQSACRQLTEYFEGRRRDFELPLAPQGTPFQLGVWQALQQLGYGERCSYRDIARHIGNANAVRAVGAANARNPLPIVIPCHRVIGANGKLTGYAGGLERKDWLLRHESELLDSGPLVRG